MEAIDVETLDHKLWLTPKEVAALLYIRDVDVVYELIKHGSKGDGIDAVNVGTRVDGRPTWRVSRVEVERFRRQRIGL